MATIVARENCVETLLEQAAREKGDDRRMQEVTNRECRGLVDMALEQCMRDIVDESNSILWTTRRDTEASLRGLRDWLQHLSLIHI